MELLGAHRFKMGDISSKFLEQIRAFGSDNENQTKTIIKNDSKDNEELISDNGKGTNRSNKVKNAPSVSIKA